MSDIKCHGGHLDGRTVPDTGHHLQFSNGVYRRLKRVWIKNGVRTYRREYWHESLLDSNGVPLYALYDN